MSIKILDTFEPAGQFELLDAINVSFDEDSNVDQELRNLNTKVDNFNRILNGIPTFKVSNIPDKAIDLGDTLIITLFVESANTAECRILIKRQKLGSTAMQTYTASCYPGQEYPVSLVTPKEIGTYRYSISVTNGTKRCGYEGTTAGDQADIMYEYVFDVICGTASLTFPNFTRINNSKIYSFGIDNNLAFDFRYIVAQTFKDYEIAVQLQKVIDDNITIIKTQKYSYENPELVSPGTLLLTSESFDFNISEIDLTAVYSLLISAQATDEVGNIIEASKIEKNVIIDLMQENSITQNVSGLDNTLTTNDYLTFQFMPKTNNTNFLTSVLKYTCSLYACDINYNTVGAPLKTFNINAYNLKTSTVSFDKFSAIDTSLSELEEGTFKKYKVVLTCVDSSITTILTTELLLNVEKVRDASGNYVTDGLVLAFDFSDDYDAETSVIDSIVQPEADNASPNIYSLQLLNARVQDIKDTGEIDSSDRVLTGDSTEEQVVERSTYFTFKKGQGAVLIDKDGYVQPTKRFYYNAELDNNATVKTGYSFEIFYKSAFLGDNTATAASMLCKADPNNADKFVENSGLTFPIGKAKVCIGNTPASVSIRQNTWRHVIAVVEKSEGQTQAKIYINGILSHVSPMIKDTDDDDGETPLALNCIYSTINNELANSGNTSIKFIRHYCKPLNDEEVYQNFLTVYTEPKYNDIIEKRNTAGSAINVFFIKNSIEKLNADKTYVDFDILNTITKKKPENDNDRDYTSKTCAVNCTMIYSYLDNEDKTVVETFPNVDVYLQGTSSLKYPVKNYQIKVYEDDNAGKKKAILPPKVDDLEWPTKSYIYTLKCDFMEESHRNNTPTACYYQDRVLDSVIDFCKTQSYFKNHIAEPDNIINSTDKLFSSVEEPDVYSPYSPARRIREVDDLGNKIIPYRDAINGRPCILYYNNNTDGLIDIKNSSISDLAASSTCAGSFMFNVDKEGPQLGFELDPYKVSNFNSNNELKINASGLLDDDGALSVSSLPCISYEGATNDNISAAAFISYKDQRVQYLRLIWDKNTNITSDGKKFFYLRKVANVNGNYQYVLDTEGDNLPLVDNTSYVSFSTFGNAKDLEQNTEIIYKDTQSNNLKVRTCESSFLAYIASIYHDKLTELDENFARALHGCNTEEEHKDIFGKNEVDYINKTLEPRFTFADDIDKEALALAGYNNDDLTYNVIRNAINWTYECFTLVESDDTREAGKIKFRDEFIKYFSFEYCLTYFLQMMLFTQVDNAGKNAMFDTWGNGKLYPRPYDMDTQMGLNNSGTDRILPSAELNAIFSPQFADPAIVNSSQGITFNENHERFVSYNTSNSALWKTFAICFDTEIKQCYAYLRNQGIYDVATIQEYINSKTRNTIGETFYNKDAKNKYLSNPDYFYCVNGSREDRYFEFLTQRITFLDSYYNHVPSNIASNATIKFRAQVIEPEDFIVLQTLSPMYVSVTAEPYTTTCLITPEDTYTEGSLVQKGSKFTFKANAANDKNMYITGSYNLSAIEGLTTLTPTELFLTDVQNLTNLDISGASAIADLTITGSDKLKTINLSGCTNLKIQLNLEACINIESIDISNSGVTSIILPERCNLKYLNCSNNTSITSLYLANIPNLTNENLRLDGCTSLSTFSIKNCPGIVSEKERPFFGDASLVAGASKKLSALKNLIIHDCPQFKYLSLRERQLNALDFAFADAGLVEIDLYGCRGSAFEHLNLSNCVKLKKLNLNLVSSNGSETDNNKLKLPRNTTFELLNLGSSEFSTVYTQEEEVGTFNFDTLAISAPINSGVNLALNGNKFIKKVSNLTYSGHLSSLFRNCYALEILANCSLEAQKTTNNSGDNTTSINYLFTECSNLSTFENCTFNFDNVVTANSVCSDCSSLEPKNLCLLIRSLGDSVTSITHFAYNTFAKVSNAILDDGKAEDLKFPASLENASSAFYSSHVQEIPKNIFKGCSKLTKADYVFYNCTKLKSISTDIFKDCSSLTTIQCGFYNCIKLKTNMVTVVKDSVEQSLFAINNKITNISYLFAHCSAMTASNSNYVNVNVFLENLPNLEYAIGTFYKCGQLSLTFNEDYVLDNSKTPNIKSTALLFVGSGLNKLPKYLANPNGGLLEYFTCARGMFSNIVPTICNTDSDALTASTTISSKFFDNCTNLEYIGDSTTIPKTSSGNNSYYYINNTNCGDSAGIFGNIPNLFVSTGVFSKLDKLKDISRAFFVGNANSITDNSYLSRSFVTANELFYTTDSDMTNAPQFYKENLAEPFEVDISNITKEDIDLFETSSQSKSAVLISANYLFAGNNNIEHLSDHFIDYLENVESLSGMLSNCIKYTGQKDGADNFHKLTQNKAKLVDVSYLYENCFELRQSLLDRDNNHIFNNTCTVNNGKLTCCAMFKGSSISGTVPVTLFNKLRNKVTDTSYMFAKCSYLTGIEQGYATDFNIPYRYDNTALNYYYDKYLDKTVYDYPNYETFIANINTYFESHRDNWFAEGESFDRYRNYLEQVFFENLRNYPNNLSKTEVESIKDTKVENVEELFENGLYYNTLTKQLIRKNSDNIEILNCNVPGCYIQINNEDNTFSYITEIAEILDLLAAHRGTIIVKKDTTVRIKSKYNFYSDNNIYTIKQQGLLSNCSALTSVRYMFAGCCGLTGSIPADLFASEKTFEYKISSIEGLFAGCTNLTLRAYPITDDSRLFVDAEIVSYKTIVQIPKELTSSKETPEIVMLGTGGNFATVYPVVTYSKTNTGWSHEILESDNTLDSGKYFIPRDWAASLKQVQSIKNLFYSVGSAAKPIYDTHINKLSSIQRVYASNIVADDNEFANKSISTTSNKTSNKYLYSYLKLDNSTFNTLKSLSDAENAFRCINTLGGTILDSNFLFIAKNTLTNITAIFTTTPVLNVKKPFNNFGSLRNVKYSFYRLFYNYTEGVSDAIPSLSPVLFEEANGLYTKPLSRLLTDTSSYQYLSDSEAPEFWNIPSILASQKQYTLTGLTKVAGKTSWFDLENNNGNSGYKIFNISTI